VMTAVAVVPFLMLSIVTYVYIRETGSEKVASLLYLVGLFPFLLWIVSIILIFSTTPGMNDEMAMIILMSYLSGAAGGYFYLILPKGRKKKQQDSQDHFAV
ncbi:MAG: hypothetical protein PVH19_13240, partial [Planctomycetia bacterium]